MLEYLKACKQSSMQGNPCKLQIMLPGYNGRLLAAESWRSAFQVTCLRLTSGNRRREEEGTRRV